jgi:hypothetical protein
MPERIIFKETFRVSPCDGEFSILAPQTHPTQGYTNLSGTHF